MKGTKQAGETHEGLSSVFAAVTCSVELRENKRIGVLHRGATESSSHLSIFQDFLQLGLVLNNRFLVEDLGNGTTQPHDFVSDDSEASLDNSLKGFEGGTSFRAMMWLCQICRCYLEICFELVLQGLKAKQPELSSASLHVAV